MEPDKEFNLTIGLRIREIREACHMTRAQFSEKCDLSDSFLTDVESGQKGVSAKTLYKICTAMNISSDYFLFGHKNGFESDMVIEMLDSLDKRAKEGAVRILREYLDTIRQLLGQE